MQHFSSILTSTLCKLVFYIIEIGDCKQHCILKIANVPFYACEFAHNMTATNMAVVCPIRGEVKLKLNSDVLSG